MNKFSTIIKTSLLNALYISLASLYSAYTIMSSVYLNFECKTSYVHAVVIQSLWWGLSAFGATFAYNIAKSYASLPKTLPEDISKIIP